MEERNSHIIAIVNQKGGVGKTTTTINLAQALAIQGYKILIVDLDPQANATQGMGVMLESLKYSIADLIKDRNLSSEHALFSGDNIDLIGSSPLLAKVEREMVGATNSELRLAHRLRALRAFYDVILVDTPPTFGPLMNSALNAADKLIVPVDSGFFALMGIKELLAEVEEIKLGTNPGLEIFGLLLTLSDNTKMTGETFLALTESFAEKVFKTRIRRTVRLREAPAIGKSIFHHDPESTGAEDYFSLAQEVACRLGLRLSQQEVSNVVPFSSEVAHG
jgi:chromosome partitioning protein